MWGAKVGPHLWRCGFAKQRDQQRHHNRPGEQIQPPSHVDLAHANAFGDDDIKRQKENVGHRELAKNRDHRLRARRQQTELNQRHANGFQQRVEDGLGAEIGRDGTEFFNELIPMGRHGTADEIAASMLYLASAQSGFTTGHLLMADGGMSV